MIPTQTDTVTAPTWIAQGYALITRAARERTISRITAERACLSYLRELHARLCPEAAWPGERPAQCAAVAPVATAAEPDRTRDRALRHRVLAIFAASDHPLTWRDLRNQLGLTEEQLRPALNRLVRSGQASATVTTNGVLYRRCE